MAFFLEPAGPFGIYVIAHRSPSEALTVQLRDLSSAIRDKLGAGIVDITQGWDSLLVQYDLCQVDYVTLYHHIEALLEEIPTSSDIVASSPELTLPVLYDGDDLPYVAQRCGLSVDEVIVLHSGSHFHVGAMGFAPGFAYLGGLDPRLDIPRRSSPRTHVPAGSVAIAAGQSALYPQDSPGGWHLIGRCPWPLFDPSRDPATPFTVGQHVRFKAIDEATFQMKQGRAP